MTMILIYYAQSYLSTSSIYPIIRDTLSASGTAAHCLNFSEKLFYFWPENSRKGRISYHGQLIGLCRLNSFPLTLNFYFGIWSRVRANCPCSRAAAPARSAVAWAGAWCSALLSWPHAAPRPTPSFPGCISSAEPILPGHSKLLWV